MIGCFPAGIWIYDFEEIWKSHIAPEYHNSSSEEDSVSDSSSISSYIFVDDEKKDWISGVKFLENSNLVFLDGKYIKIAPVI